jgi:intracellular septation protein A
MALPAESNAIGKGGDSLAVSLSLVLVFGIAVWVLHRYAGLKFWHAVVCVLFGFFLATTAAAPMIRSAVATIVALISGQH